MPDSPQPDPARERVLAAAERWERTRGTTRALEVAAELELQAAVSARRATRDAQKEHQR